ncbi:MAG: DegT/DnrJ/EryC1/StrS family aminotransferase, partial [Candidatus Hydrogenedentes bacterium]|nr:DegT/DnrJ/EryC1/StrS family aminotransferase [Candidatus Hydrogenedentota bacterium]
MIPHSKPTIGTEEMNAVSRVLHSGQLAQGAEVEAFEKDCADMLGRKFGVAVNSGTAALHLAISGFGVARDAEWGTGSKQFLREFFEGKHGTYKNFFNDILEPLFYEALRIDRSHDDDYYSKFNCKIPFLNGGLFDPINNYDWVHTDILIPNNLFSNSDKTKEGDTGTGILDV